MLTFAGTLNSYAQEEVLVNVTAKSNPLPAQAASYATDPGRFFNITLQNLKDQNVPVRLELRVVGPLEGGDIWPSASSSYIEVRANRPLDYYMYLGGNQTRTVTQSELNTMFSKYSGDEKFVGGDLSNVFNDVGSGSFGLLREGRYGLKVTAKTNYVDQNDPGNVIGENVCFFDICYNASAPSFTNPTFTDNGEYLTTTLSFENSMFRWTEPTFNNSRLTTVRQFYYDFSIMRVEPGKTPYEAAQNGAVAFQQKGLLTPSCQLPVNVLNEMLRSGTDRFVAQVTARSMVTDASNAQYAMVANGGKSQLLVLNVINTGGGQDGNLVFPESGEYPIKVTIEPKFSELTKWMDSYLSTPGDLFNITLENTTNTTYQFSMLLQFFRGNWAICADPQHQYTDHYMTISGKETLELTKDQINTLAGGYELNQAITFKAQTGFIIGPPTQEFFPDKDYKAAVRICNYSGNGTPVLRNPIIGKNRCDFLTSNNVLTGEEFKVVFEPKMAPMPANPQDYFTDPSRLFNIKIKNLTTRARNIKPVIEYNMFGESYLGQKEVGLGESDFIYLSADEEVTLTSEQMKQFFGDMTSVLYTPEEGSPKELTDFNEILFSSSEDNENIAKLKLYDWNTYKASVLGGESVEDALIQETEANFKISYSVSLGRVDITLSKALEDMPLYGFHYITEPGRLFSVKLKNTTGETLRLKPYLTYRQSDGGRYEYTPEKGADLETIPVLELLPYDEITLSMAELNEYCAAEGSVVSTDEDAAKAERYDHETQTYEMVTEFHEMMTTEKLNTAKFTLVNADSVELISEDDPDFNKRIFEGEGVLEFDVFEDADLSVIDVIVTKRLEEMPTNVLPHFNMPGNLWKVELRNTLDVDMDVCLMPIYAFGESDGIRYSTRTFDLDEKDIITIGAKDTRELTPEEINELIAHSTAIQYREEAEGLTLQDPIDADKLEEVIEVSTSVDNVIVLYAIDPEMCNPENRKGKTFKDFNLGYGSSYWKASEGVRLDLVTVTVKPKQKKLTSVGKTYFDSPGALFDVSIQNNTNVKRKVALSISYLFDETGDYFSGTYPGRIDTCYFELEPGFTKELTAAEVNRMLAKPEKVYRYHETPEGLVPTEVTDFSNIVNLTSFNQVEVVAYERDSLINIPETETNRKTRSFLGAGKSDFQTDEDQKYVGISVKVEPKKNVTFSTEPEAYFNKPADYFDVTLANESTEDLTVGLRLTLNKRFYGADRPDTILLKAGKTVKLSADRLNKICGGYKLDGDIAEVDSLGKLKGIAKEDSIVMKNGVNMMTALLWKNLQDGADAETKYDSICAHDTIFTPAMSEVKIGDYVLTIEDATKLEGKDEEQNKLLNECYSGSGYITIEPLGFPVKLAVEWDTIYVNWKQGIVTKGKVNSKTNEESFMPEKLFDDDFVNSLSDSQKEVYESEIKAVLEESNIQNYYSYVQKDMQYLKNLTSGDGVVLPVGLAFPMAEGGECPADIQIAKMEFTPEKATMDIMGEFTLPESDYLGVPTKNDDGTYTNNSEILIFGAQDLELPEKGSGSFLPPSGALGLLADFTIHDPESDFEFTFIASSKRFSEATDGCFIAWENDEFKKLTATIQINIPTDKIVSDADPTKHVNARMTAMIADGSNWTAQVTMEPFQVPDWEGYTFIPTGESLTGPGILYDHSPTQTPEGIKFHPAYNSEIAGIGTKDQHPNSNAKVYNEWQGFYWEKIAVKFPHFVEIQDEADKRLALEFTMMYDNKFSGGLVASNLFNRRTAEAGGWGLSVDTVSLDIVQGDFYGAGFEGTFEIPLLYTKASGESGERQKAKLGYRADIYSIAKTSTVQGGTGVIFKIQQLDEKMGLDFMLAEAELDKSKTWFKIDYSSVRPESKRTFVELMLGGAVNISCTEKLGFTLPGIPFSNMRLANCTPEEMKQAEKDAKNRGNTEEQKPQSQTQSTASSEVESIPVGSDHFSMGDWNYSENDKQPGEDKSKFNGLDFKLNSISPKFAGSALDSIGVYINGGISIMGGKNNGIETSAGITIWSKVDWAKKDFSYAGVSFNDLEIKGNFGGVVEISGSFEMKDDEGVYGFGTKPDAPLKVKIKGLFEAQMGGAYYKVQKTAEDFATDDDEEKKDSVYHAGYFTMAAETSLSMGLVSLKSISGGFFINYGTNAEGQGEDEKFIDVVTRNAKLKYKSYGGFFGLGLVVGQESLVKGDASLMIMMDMSGEKCKVHDFHLQGNVHALCAPDSDKGLINGRMDIIYADGKEDEKGKYSVFDLNITAKAELSATDMIKDVTGVDFEKLASDFMGQKFEVPEALGNLMEFDQKNADPENQGEGTDTSDKSSTAEKNGLKASVGFEISMAFQVRDYDSGDTKWHLYVGEPDEEKRCRITFIDFEVGKDKPVGMWAKAYANMYLCLGNELPNDGALPELPAKVKEALGYSDDNVDTGTTSSDFKAKVQKAQQETLNGVKGEIDGGVMVGAAIGAEFGVNALFCYCTVEGMAGFDLVLKKFAEGERCRGGNRMGGKNGFYATGQMYAYLAGEVGLMLDLWIYKGKIPLADITLGALLKAGFPNPTWAFGRVRAKGSVLGGLVKFESAVEFKMGNVCLPEFGNPLDDVKIFGDVAPGDDEFSKGWAAREVASVYTTPTFTTNMKIGKHIPLIDEGKTAERMGLDDDDDGGDATATLDGQTSESSDPTNLEGRVDENTYLRTYVFLLGSENQSLPKFAMYVHSDSTTSADGTYLQDVGVLNPSNDKENFELQVPALGDNKFYSIKLRGYAKEVVENGKLVDPIFNDEDSDWKDEERKWSQEITLYFRTGEASKNLADDVAAFFPSEGDYNDGWTNTLEDAADPRIVLGRDRAEYFEDPNYEFVVDVKKRIYNGREWTNVWPDAMNGLVMGQKSQFSQLPVVLYEEKGADEYGDKYHFQSLKLKKPLPTQYLSSGIYIYQLYRINRKLMQQHINLIEEKYESIMALTDEERERYEQELESMNTEDDNDPETVQILKDLYEYYKEMEGKFGEAEVEQRMMQYKEQFSSNTDAYAELVFERKYYYNGKENFQKYVLDNAANTNVTFGSGVHQWGKGIHSVGLSFRYDRLLTKSGTDRMNDVYRRLHWWHSDVYVWPSNIPKYRLCDYLGEFYQPRGQFDFEPAYPAFRQSTYQPALLPTKKLDGKFEDFAKAYDPVYAKNNANSRWHNISTTTGMSLAGEIVYTLDNIYMADARTVEAFEQAYQEAWDDATNRGQFGNMTTTQLNGLKSVVNNAAVNPSYISGQVYGADGNKSKMSVPVWQLGLIYAADVTTMGLDGYIVGRQPSEANYVYCYSPNRGPWNLENFYGNISGYEWTVRYKDGYNLLNNTYDIRPEKRAYRAAKMKYTSSSFGTNVTSDKVYMEVEEFVNIPDPNFRAYLIDNFDSDGNDTLTIAELHRATKIDLNAMKYGVSSFAGMEHLVNVTEFKLTQLGSEVRYSGNGIESYNLDFSALPKLNTLTLSKCFIKRLDLSKCPNLKTLHMDVTYTVLDFGEDSNIETFSHTNRVSWAEGGQYGVFYPQKGKYYDLRSLRKLRTINMIGYDATLINEANKHIIYQEQVYDANKHQMFYKDLDEPLNACIASDTIDLRGLANIDYSTAAFGSYFHKYVYVKTDGSNLANTYLSKLGSGYDNSKNWNVQLTAIDEVSGAQVDQGLWKALNKAAKQYMSSTDRYPTIDHFRQITSLDASGYGIKTIQYLDYYCPNLETLVISDNDLKEMNISALKELTSVVANNNEIGVITLPYDSKITNLNVADNMLASLSMDRLKHIHTLNVSNNHLGELYVNECAELTSLDCSYNHLTELVMTALTGLQSVNCSNNQFEQNRLQLPQSGSALKTVIADKCIKYPCNLDFTTLPLEVVKMSDNSGIQSVKVNTSVIKTFILRNCNLRTQAYDASSTLDISNGYGNLDTIDVSGNPNLKVKLNYKPENLGKLRYVNFTGCDVQNNITFTGSLSGSLQLRAGVPQRMSGDKVKVVATGEFFNDIAWLSNFKEWRGYAENQHTVAFYYGDKPVTDEDAVTTLEAITEEDLKFRNALGEEGYKIWKKKYAPNKRALHVADLASVTDVELKGFKVNNVDSVTMYTPKVKNLVINGDYKTIRLSAANDMVYLRIENNSVLDTVNLAPSKPYLTKWPNTIEVKDSRMVSYVASYMYDSKRQPKRLIFSNLRSTPPYDYIHVNNPDVNYYVNGGDIDFRINDSMLGDCDSIVLSNIKTLVLTGNSDVLKNVPIPYVALSDSFSVRSGNARISEANITNWTNPTQESFDALMASVGGTLTINGIATVATPLKWTTATMGTLNIINSANDILMGPGAFALNATDATLRFPENYLSFAKQIREFNLNGNCTIKFMSADVLLKWLYVWKQQAGGANVTMAVASDDPAKQSLVTMVNTYISSGQLDVDKLDKKTVITAINKLVTDGYIPAGTAYNEILKEVAGDDLYQQLRYAAGNYSVRLVSAPKHTGTYKILKAVLECTLREASDFQAAAPCVLKDSLSEESAMKLKNELDAEFVANGYDAVFEVVEGNSAETVDEEEVVETTGTDVQGETASQNTATTTTTTTRTMAVSSLAKYDLILTSYGSAKLAVIKAVRECVDLTLAQAKTLVEAAPVTVAKGIDRVTAANYKQILEAAGATVEVKLVSGSNSTTTSVTTPRRILSL